MSPLTYDMEHHDELEQKERAALAKQREREAWVVLTVEAVTLVVLWLVKL